MTMIKTVECRGQMALGKDGAAWRILIDQREAGGMVDQTECRCAPSNRC